MKSIKLGKMTMKYREYYTQIQALDGFDDVERKNLLLFAFDAEKDDKSKMGQKMFTRFPIPEIWKVESLLNSNRYAYEWIPKNIHIKPFIDCEMEGEIFTLEESEKRIHLFIVFVCREMNLFFDCKLKSDDLLLLNSSREGKLSYHLVIQNGLYFDSMPEHKKLMLWLRHKFLNPSQDNEEEAFKRSMLTWHRTCNNLVYETKSIFDMAVYSDNQKFRCINQSKYG